MTNEQFLVIMGKLDEIARLVKSKHSLNSDEVRQLQQRNELSKLSRGGLNL